MVVLLAGCAATPAPPPKPAAAPASIDSTAAAPASIDSTAAVRDALRSKVASDLAQRVSLKTNTFRIADGYAFVTARALDRSGKPVDFYRTRYREAIDQGTFDGEDYPIIALLQNQGGKWLVKAYSVGAMDVPWVGWWDEFGAPRSLFPYPSY